MCDWNVPAFENMEIPKLGQSRGAEACEDAPVLPLCKHGLGGLAVLRESGIGVAQILWKP